MCRHKYSCLENIIRSVYHTVGFYIVCRVLVKAVFKDNIDEVIEKVPLE